VIGDRKIPTAFKTNEIAGFVSVSAWEKCFVSYGLPYSTEFHIVKDWGELGICWTFAQQLKYSVQRT